MGRIASLSARLTVQFALLFAAAMLVVSAALSTLISRNAADQVKDQLQSSGAVYDRLWHLRSNELADAAELLAKDFGFRAAVATGERTTSLSALENARARLSVDNAYLVGVNGSVDALDGSVTPREARSLWAALDEGRSAGITELDGQPRQLAAAPVLAPNLVGWVVFAADLDEAQMRSLERLSAIPLDAEVLIRRDGRWLNATNPGSKVDARLAQAADAHSSATSAFEAQFGDEPAIALTKPLPAFTGETQALLLLAYPKSKALAAAGKLKLALALMTLLGVGLVAFATWRASRRITRPLEKLDEAAGRLAAGEHAKVPVEGHDELARLSGSFNEMVERIEERERRITHLAYNDVLTGLPNRSMFQRHVEHCLRAAESELPAIALHCLDLDRFKSVNDTMGHPAGDALLVGVAGRVAEVARGHFVARLGGDEFVVVQSLRGEANEVERLARDLIDAVFDPLTIEGQQIVPSTSIGIAIGPADGKECGALLKNADLALYRAKEAGRGTYAFFEETLNERAQERRKLENDLRIAIEQGQLELYYQPLFDLEKHRIGSFEALMRWNHPVRGQIPPTDFIPVAEDTGLIVPIGEWALQEACRQAASWPDHIRVAVNVSPIQLQRPGLAEVIMQALAKSQLEPARLEVEITESVFLAGTDTTMKLLHSLRSIGVRIALDDFGTGYSSLSYLQSFPFDKLKIDRSFIQHLLVRPGAVAGVRAITDLAAALGMATTAEGVEEDSQLAELRNQGCSSVQGFLFARPMPARQVRKLLAQRGGKASQKVA